MLSPAELALLALAGYRATQIVVHDSFLDPARDRVLAWQQEKPDSHARDAVVTLISCVYCTGWWVAGALLATWLLATGSWDGEPLVVHGVEWLGVAGASVLLNRWDDTRTGT